MEASTPLVFSCDIRENWRRRRRPPTDLGARPTHHVRANPARTRRASGPTPDSPQDQRAGAVQRPDGICLHWQATRPTLDSLGSVGGEHLGL